MATYSNNSPSPCVDCSEVEKCEAKGSNDPCRAFRRYACEGQNGSIPWVPEDRGVFDNFIREAGV